MVGGPGQNTGRVNLEIFVQANNVLNNVNYMSYSGVVASDFFGQATCRPVRPPHRDGHAGGVLDDTGGSEVQSASG